MAKFGNERFVFVDDPAFQKALDKGTRQALSKWGAYMRRTARQSMKRRKGAAPPGQPPHVHEGSIKRLLFFYYDTQTKSVVIGPEIKKHNPTGAPNVMEFGGVAGHSPVPYVSFKVGKPGPVRLVDDGKGGVRPVWAMLKTDMQVMRAIKLWDEYRRRENARRVHILPRPYMYPAMKKNLHVAPACFQAMLKGN